MVLGVVVGPDASIGDLRVADSLVLAWQVFGGGMEEPEARVEAVPGGPYFFDVAPHKPVSYGRARANTPLVRYCHGRAPKTRSREH